MQGEEFDSDELFWDQRNQRVYSDKYIEIKRGVTEIKGYGFESNQSMTDYRIFRPHDGKLPFSEGTPDDTLQSDSLSPEILPSAEAGDVKPLQERK